MLSRKAGRRREARPSECYVYVQLPGEHTMVTAGKYRLDTSGPQPIGRFVYGQSYLARPAAVELDPIELPLVRRTYETAALGGIFGALRDASPDAWGRLVIQKHLNRTDLSELDYLLHSPEDRAGALSFGLNAEPPPPVRQFNRTLHLGKILDFAERILRDEELPGVLSAVERAHLDQVAELVNPGTSMGGARPKNVVEDDEGLWLAKLPAPRDPWNYTRVEHATLVLARECGLSVATGKRVTVAGKDVVLIRRFDREKTEQGYLRARMASGLTLMHSEDTPDARQDWSYIRLAEELARWGDRVEDDLHELFRRMAFNALISNLDDHPRNHAVIAPGKTWRLSPAYDLTPSAPVSIERRDLAMVCGRLGRWANRENLLSECARFRYPRADAASVINEMVATLRSRWRPIFRREGVTERDCDRLAPAFVYPGFDFPGE